MDSTEETQKHIQEVRSELSQFTDELFERGLHHDASKLVSPEKELFDKYTPLLKELVYGSPEYKESLEKLKPALDHHYAVNSHHPEHFQFGINEMTLMDVVEMYCDWKAAVKRNKDGNFLKSLDVNRKRFEMSDQLYGIFVNTYHQQKHVNGKDER